MKKQEYCAWLEGTMKPASIKDRISRCARVEEALGVDLDEEFDILPSLKQGDSY